MERAISTISGPSGSAGSPSNEFATGRAVVKNLQELCEGEVNSIHLTIGFPKFGKIFILRSF